MAEYIDEHFWYDALAEPGWYLTLAEDYKKLGRLAWKEKDPVKRKSIKREAYEMVEQAVEDDRIPLAQTGDDFDKDRKPVDTIVIHHTKNPPGMTLERLNAMQLLRLYGMYYADPTDPKEKHLKGQPVWSGHFYNDSQVFWCYHWLVRNDGNLERILDDRYIGWHAGNWDVNTRSIAICIDDDLTQKEPSETVVGSIAELISSKYPGVNPANVVGHCDVSHETECPGYLFHESWRAKLVEALA
jgi:hypothetical protein